MTAARKQPSKKRAPSVCSDRKLRELVAIAYASPEIAGELHVKNLKMIVDWIKTGDLPPGDMRRGQMHEVGKAS